MCWTIPSRYCDSKALIEHEHVQTDGLAFACVVSLRVCGPLEVMRRFRRNGRQMRMDLFLSRNTSSRTTPIRVCLVETPGAPILPGSLGDGDNQLHSLAMKSLDRTFQKTMRCSNTPIPRPRTRFLSVLQTVMMIWCPAEHQTQKKTFCGF